MATNKRSKPPLEDEVLTRPESLVTKKGNAGEPVSLQANYFKLNSGSSWCLYQYHVDIAPEEDRTNVRKALLRNHKALLGGYIFDGTCLYTSKPLQESLELNSIRQEDNQPIIIKIRFIQDLPCGDYHYLQIFNMIIRKILEKLDLQLVGRNYFDAAQRVLIREYGLELWPGYITSIRHHEQSMLMCAEISHKVMRHQTLYDIMDTAYQKSPKNWKRIVQGEVIGCVVLTDYNNRTYRVDDIDFETSPSETFKQRDGSDISYADYYKQKYQIKIRDLTQPLLVSKSTMRDRRAGRDEIIYLIPELCRSTGLTDEMRGNFHLMKALADHTRVGPGLRIKSLLTFNQRLKNKSEIDKELQEWSFHLDSKLVELEGRVLPAEIVYFGKNSCVQLKENPDWNFEMQKHPQLIAGQLKDWVAVIPIRCEREASTFINAMIKAAADVSFNMNRPRIITIPDDRTDTYSDALLKLTDQYNPQIVFCVVTNNQAMRYAAIKKILCIKRGIPSQVVLARTLVQKKASMLATIGCKVATQINCKLGGCPWTVKLGQLLPNMMVVGFDVCHDKKSGGSYGAMVASLDQNYGRYFSTVTRHERGVELSNDLSIQLIRAINEYIKENAGTKPARILIYRDGVGEGQLPFVLEHEVNSIKEKLAKVYGGADKYMLGFIVVTKRINTRFFMNGENPKAGTVVDDVVTDPLKYDFFLVSQSVRQGTVAPTAYNVIEDTTKLDPNKMQRVTYKLCHLYFNYSGTVRVPAPCQYAHKLAFFASQTLDQSPHQKLEKTLYFL